MKIDYTTNNQKTACRSGVIVLGHAERSETQSKHLRVSDVQGGGAVAEQ